MMKVSITNKGTTGIEVPVASLIANSSPVTLALAPEEIGEAVFLVPPANHEVQRALEEWAAANGHTLSLSFAPNMG